MCCSCLCCRQQIWQEEWMLTRYEMPMTSTNINHRNSRRVKLLYCANACCLRAEPAPSCTRLLALCRGSCCYILSFLLFLAGLVILHLSRPAYRIEILLIYTSLIWIGIIVTIFMMRNCCALKYNFFPHEWTQELRVRCYQGMRQYWREIAYCCADTQRHRRPC